MMQWIQAHQVMLLVMWPVLTAVASLVYKSLDGNPRWHAVFSLLISFGIDLPKMWDAIGRLVTGNPPNGGSPTGAMKGKETLTFPKKPAVMRVRQWAAAFMLAVAACFVTATTGCNGLNIVSIVTQLSTYVTAFIQVAQTIWATILPLLGSNSATANVAFQDAIVSLQNANALMMDGEQAYEAGKTVNLPQLMQAVQDAVARVMNVINQFKGQMPAHAYATTDTLQTLERMSTSIQHWQVQQ